jgi:hypothetical protein
MTTDDNGDPAESFSMRGKQAVPVVIDGIDPAFRVRMWDLDTRCMTEIDPTKPLGLGVTDHDFVLLMERR